MQTPSVRSGCGIVLSLAIGCGIGLGVRSARAEEALSVDVVPFGQVTHWDDQGKDYGVMWEDARDIFRVVVTFAEGSAPKPGSLRLQYWQSQWPHRRIPRDRPCGAGSSGWLDIGDWFQGRWRDADVNVEAAGAKLTYTFRPTNAKEYPDLKDFAVAYRTTMKLRLLSEVALPKIAAFQAYTDSVYKPMTFEIEWGGNAQAEQTWDGFLEVFNGKVEKVEPLADGGVQMEADRSWRSSVKGKTDGIRATVSYAETASYNSFDETVITVRNRHETFSFATVDLLKRGPIFMPAFGVLVRQAGKGGSYAEARAAWVKIRQHPKNLDPYSRVYTAPEQTFTQSWNDTPTKEHQYIPISFEGSRQHFGVEADGDVFLRNNWIAKIHGKDTDRCRWKGEGIEYEFGLPGTRPLDRSLVDGYLPMIVARWEKGGVCYQQTVLAIPLTGVPKAGGRVWADDTLVLMARIEMKLTTGRAAEAQLNLRVDEQGTPPKLQLDGNLIFRSAGQVRHLRMKVASSDRPESYTLAPAEDGKSVAYRAALSAEAPNRTLDIAIPYTTLTEPKEFEELGKLAFAKAFEDVRAYWIGRLRCGTQITTPEPMINDFYKAHMAHLLINTEREAGVSDRYMAKVGTFSYGVFSNESCMMISDLDRRGYHERAEQALETWLFYQGTVGLPGDFSTSEGQLYGAGGCEHGGYNQHHGWILWCLGEHYWYTRDTAWLEHAAPFIIKGCDWIIKERHRTIAEAKKTPIRAIESGLLPPGRLEDIGDWRSWQSTNTYSCWGMANAAAALNEAGHPEGRRLVQEAEKYRRDILACFGEAMRRSPVVRLRDGSWVPHIPSDVHRRGRSFGWITETLEGAIHLIRCGLIDPQDKVSTWIIQDFEDNLYLSEQYGYSMPPEQFERFWFSLGGISMQANLLCNPIPYLLRDEPKHFLRAYFNAFAVSYFADTRMMTEHALPNIGDWRGDHYKSSDEANSTYWLRMMFIQERGDELWVGAALPRYWLADGQKVGIERAETYYGPMSVRVESRAAQGSISMTIDPPRRNPPRLIRARFRHPDGLPLTRVAINGQPSTKIDVAREWVEVAPSTVSIRIVAQYE